MHRTVNSDDNSTGARKVDFELNTEEEDSITHLVLLTLRSKGKASFTSPVESRSHFQMLSLCMDHTPWILTIASLHHQVLEDDKEEV